jgi:antitoxin VapB
MGLNIKNPEACALAKKVALITGESMTEAIFVALRQRLDGLESQKRADKEARWTRMMAVLADIDAHGGGRGMHSSDHNDLYDENGLPK